MPYARVVLGPRYAVRLEDLHVEHAVLIEGPLPELSPRETEILTWVARGKSNPLIAEILGISSHTVDAHLRRIRRRRPPRIRPRVRS